MASAVERERVLARLRWDFGFYAPRCLSIIDPAGTLIPFVLKPAQVKLWEALAAQRDRGEPMRANVLKARKVGFSTMTQGLIVQRASQLANHRALVVAQDNDTAGELFDMGRIMWTGLPAEVKPPLMAERNSKGGKKYMGFGNRSSSARRDGDLGLNSSIEIDTAKEVQAGRGRTIHSLHLSEVAFWNDVRKMTSLLNAVPDDPMTLIIKESTANGQNHWKDDWDRAEAGESAYAAVFVSWLEEAGYQRPFTNDDERAAFEQTVGTGPYGEEEPELMEVYGATLEQLAWRRWTIVNKCEGQLDTFHQEYPTTPEQAFLSTGSTVFDKVRVRAVLRAAAATDPAVPSEATPGPETGALQATGTRQQVAGGGDIVTVPTGAEFAAATGREALWRVWERPVAEVVDIAAQEFTPAGQYVIGVDVMSGDDTATGEQAWHAIEVIDHRSRAQVAEYVSRVDPDELAMQVLLAALWFNNAWVAPEMTGGWGLPVIRKLAIAYKYPFVYARQALDHRTDKWFDRLGWDTNRATKSLLISGAKEVIRGEEHGVRSRLLAREMQTYVKDQRGRTMPEAGKHSDRLMAWMIAQEVAQERPLRPTRKSKPTSTTTRTLTSAVTGW